MIERVDGGGTTKEYEISVSFHRLVMDWQWTGARQQGGDGMSQYLDL